LDVSCIVLAGGKSRRLGRNKVIEKIGDQSLLERVVSSLSVFKSEIIIVTAKESALPQLTSYPKLKLVNDIYPGKGSLGGIYTGLVSSESFKNVVVACDMPFLNLKLLRYMVDLTTGYDAVVPRACEDILEPLHAVYTKDCIPKIELLIKQDRLSILELFPLVKVRYVENAEINKFDSEHISFFNVNTEADLQAGKKLADRGELNSDKR
jgi:molybdenum cofactor guanylyltransferase